MPNQQYVGRIVEIILNNMMKYDPSCEEIVGHIDI